MATSDKNCSTSDMMYYGWMNEIVFYLVAKMTLSCNKVLYNIDVVAE